MRTLNLHTNHLLNSQLRSSNSWSQLANVESGIAMPKCADNNDVIFGGRYTQEHRYTKRIRDIISW